MAREDAFEIFLKTLNTGYPPIKLPPLPTTNIYIEDSLETTIISINNPNNIIEIESNIINNNSNSNNNNNNNNNNNKDTTTVNITEDESYIENTTIKNITTDSNN